jgi:signal transduction histidine kinase
VHGEPKAASTIQHSVAPSITGGNDRSRALFNAIDTGFCIVEMIYAPDGAPTDYRFLEVNPAFERHTGLKNPVGRTIREMVPQHDQWWFEIYAQVARTGQPTRFEQEARAMGRWYDVYAFPVDHPGRAAPAHAAAEGWHVGILFTDTTERRRAEQLLRDANEELERFASIASHDLREPLRGIASLARFVLEDEPSLTPEGRARLARSIELCVRLNEMVGGLLEYATAGGARPLEPCELPAVVANVLETLALSLREKNATVTVHQQPRLPTVKGDCLLLERVFANLITNAVRYNDSPQKRIEIGVAGDEVYIRDNGVGIDPSDQQRIFDLFGRAAGAPRPSPDETPQGIGLGLALVKKIMSRHAGSVRVESQPGQGSTFFLRFPPL